MATTSEHTDNNGNINTNDNDDKKKKEEEEEEKTKKLQSSSTDSEQNEKVDDLNKIGKTDTLSAVQSTDENKQSDQTSPTSDTNTEKKNEEKTVETTTTTQQKEESGSTPDSSTSTTTVTSSNTNNDEDSKKDKSLTPSATSNDTKKEESTTLTSDGIIKNEQSTSQLAASNSNKDDKNNNSNTFPIEKDDGQHLTDFQRQKAKYFFNINLDIENKEYVTWEDVEFYLLFHATTAGKEGSDGGDLEARLSRSARAFWEHVHDQVPLPDGKRDTLTLNQFLDTWASLIDYVVRTNELPPIVEDLVKLGFELYSTDNGDEKSATIQPQAFDQLFQKMNLGRPFAIMAFKYLTENGTKPLDADAIDSIVKAVITSSDDEHESHFLLPGFFKTIANNKNNEKDIKNKSSSPVQDKEQSEISAESSPTSNPSSPSSSTSTPSPQSQQPNQSSPSSQPQSSNVSSVPSPQKQQKPSGPPPPSSSQSQQQNSLSSPFPQGQKPNSSPPTQKQSNSVSQNGVIKSATSANQQQNVAPPPPPPPLKSQKAVIQQEDANIRDLLRYYHIDDGDIVEVAGGSVQRLVLVHPERPLPPYIQQNQQLLQKLQSGSTNVSSVPQNGFNHPSNRPSNNEKSLQETTVTSAETKPKITLQERVSRGEVQTGPTVPLRQGQKQDGASSTGVRQVYPQLNEAQQEEQRKQARLQATQSINVVKQTTEETSAANDQSSSKQDETKRTKDITRNEEDKIIAAILKQLAPIVEKRVAAELRRIQSGETDEDEDDDMIPFPFMLGGGGFPFFAAPRGGPPPQLSREQGQEETSQQNPSGRGQQQANGVREASFGGLPGGAAFIPPQLLMAMMGELARGGMGEEMPSFPLNMPPSSHGPVGVEGFMMFADDDDQMMGGPPGYPQRPVPRF